MRPIDADALIEKCGGWYVDECTESGFIGTLKDILAAQPTIQPEPKEGHWINCDGSYICSECNGSPIDFIGTMGISFDAYVETPMNYCPNCGARMKGERQK